jgi:hypothetical protein
MWSVHIELPEILLRSERTHNRFVRTALEDNAGFHHKNVMREHFRPEAKDRYGHAPRSDKYRKWKTRRWGADVDLFKTGRTKNAILGTAKVLTSGSASSETLRTRLLMRLPFGGGTGEQMDDASKGLPVSPKKLAEFRAKLDSMHQARGRTGVTPAQMVKELQAVTAEEIKAANKRIGARYVELIKTELKRPRLLAGKTI